MLYVGHEVPKGRIEEASSAPTGALVPLPAEQVADLVDPIPPPALAVDLGDRMSQRARQVFSAMAKGAIIAGTVAATAAAAPLLIVGGAVGALASLDPVILGTIPAVSTTPGSPAAWYVLARWDW